MIIIDGVPCIVIDSHNYLLIAVCLFFYNPGDIGWEKSNIGLDHLNVSNKVKWFEGEYDFRFIVIRCDWMKPDSFVVDVNYTDLLALDDGTDRLYRNVGRELPPYAA